VRSHLCVVVKSPPHNLNSQPTVPTATAPGCAVAEAAELSKLQREYRQAEGQRKTWGAETTMELRKQEAALLTLEEDNQRLKEELSLVQAEGNSMKAVAGRLDELQLQASGYESLIEQEGARVSDLDSEVCAIFHRVWCVLCFVRCAVVPLPSHPPPQPPPQYKHA
jgi:hypothetical protein